MKHHLPPLDSLKVFESAARHLSFSKAADELCITKGAVSYRIRKLEEFIEQALFKRLPRQVYLTDAGQELLQTTQRLFRDLNDALARFRPGSAKSAIVIAATTYVAVRWLSPKVAGFLEVHPEASIVFQHSVNAADFKLQDVDLAIRWGRCDRRNANCLQEMPMPMFPVCSPSLLERLQLCGPLDGDCLSQPPLNRVTLLCEDRALDLWQAWDDRPGVQLNNPRRTLADANVRVQAAIDGQGLMLADALMQAELNSGTLIAPFDKELNGYGYTLLSAPSRFSNKYTEALKAWLMGEGAGMHS